MSLNVITVKLFCISKNQFLKNLCSGTQCGGFQFLLILDLWGISFHAVVVFGLGKNLLFKSVLGHCGQVTISHDLKHSSLTAPSLTDHKVCQ